MTKKRTANDKAQLTWRVYLGDSAHRAKIIQAERLEVSPHGDLRFIDRHDGKGLVTVAFSATAWTFVEETDSDGVSVSVIPNA